MNQVRPRAFDRLRFDRRICEIIYAIDHLVRPTEVCPDSEGAGVVLSPRRKAISQLDGLLGDIVLEAGLYENCLSGISNGVS